VDDVATAMELSNHHRDTIEHIFDRPSSGNVEWREVLSLLEAIGDVDEEPNGRYRVTFGGETEVFVLPHGKDVDLQVLVDLRRMLRNAGLEPPTNRAEPYPFDASGDEPLQEPTSWSRVASCPVSRLINQLTARAFLRHSTVA
jgi:hypothetical protein